MAPSSTDSAGDAGYPKHPFQLTVENVQELLHTDQESGLSAEGVTSAREKYGENMLSGDEGVKWYKIMTKQISNAMILVSMRPASGTRRDG